VIPVKPFALAKRRLAPVLSAEERAQFARVMLEDTLAAIVACPRVTGTIVVTRDRAVAEVARSFGADALAESAVVLNAAVHTAAAFLHRKRDAGMIVVPADIPLLPSALVEQLIDHISAPPVVAFVPATRDGGTNLFACRPPGAIAPVFGPDSFRRHCQAARDAGLTPVVTASADAGLDIDVPDDLVAFLATPSRTRSHAFLMSLGVAQRLVVDVGKGKRRRTADA
jgi:2-phospho-L-lactate guanylyltransferase